MGVIITDLDDEVVTLEFGGSTQVQIDRCYLPDGVGIGDEINIIDRLAGKGWDRLAGEIFPDEDLL